VGRPTKIGADRPACMGVYGNVYGNAQRISRHFGVAHKILKTPRNLKKAKTPIKKGLKLLSDPFKVVAGVGFEPTTFRLWA
jgi:hypothetical protein